MDWVIVAATVVIAGSSAASLVVTWRLSQDSRALREAGTEPEVVAHLDLDETLTYVQLVLENIGQGPAYDVSYCVDADPDDFAEHDVRSVTPNLTCPVGLLPQGGRRSWLMGSGMRVCGNDEGSSLQPFCVTVSYSNIRGEHNGPKNYPIDVAAVRGSYRDPTPMFWGRPK